MPVEYFVYPEHESDARRLFERVPDMIAMYAQLCGEYPFLQEKYGMAAFPWGGAMEHQTLTSMCADCTWGDEDQDGIYAHELAHQWWGDDVTCATWNDIWLNEGFATYFEALWLSHLYEIPMGALLRDYYDDGAYNGYLGGTVYIKDGNDPFGDVGAIYLKGSWVLHMLRKVLGEEAFWGALRDYRAAHAYSNASTADLRAACEGRYGAPLDWFFDQWVYTPKRPVYSVSFTQTGTTAAVTVTQSQQHKVKNRSTQRDVYVMPVDITLYYEGGASVTRTVMNDRRSQTFSFDVAGTVSSVGFDEESWILKVVK
jgi:aminopeptidase N